MAITYKSLCKKFTGKIISYPFLTFNLKENSVWFDSSMEILKSNYPAYTEFQAKNIQTCS